MGEALLEAPVPYFGTMKAKSVSSAALRGYVEHRKGQGAANTTINRELSVLSSAFTLAHKEGPASSRKSFPSPACLSQMADRALSSKSSMTPWPLTAPICTWRATLALAYSFGFRKAELLTLKVSDVDLLAGTVRLRTSKDGDP
jgi:site-specific recombinase XerD